MSIFGTPKPRSGNLGGPDNVVILGEGQSIVMTYRDPNAAVEISISNDLKDMGTSSIEAAIALGKLQLKTNSNDPDAIKDALAAIKIVAGLNPATSWFVTSIWGVDSAFDEVVGKAINTIKNRPQQVDAIVDGALGISPLTNTATATALNWVAPRRDPLVLDLDGGGITTSAINPAAPILFDQDGDGTLTATGWIAAGEAIVVRDLNGNGLIDSGRELFGVDTVLSGTPGLDAVYASTGFAALKTLDSNNDNLFNAADAAFTQVQIWQDVNQDGISQSTELFTLA
ncbi:MAG: hypothetical protein RL211_1652, partial [Pseudomonadota bacterium]